MNGSIITTAELKGNISSTNNIQGNVNSNINLEGELNISTKEIQPELAEKTITANGTYNATSDNVYGYSSVSVDVPNYATELENAQVEIETKKAIIDGLISGNKDIEIYSEEATIREYCFAGVDCTKVELPNVTVLPNRTFYTCSKLKEVYLPKVTSMGTYCFFTSGSNLTLDFPVLTDIKNYALRACNVTKLILRSPTVCTLANVDTLGRSPIDTGKGFVYVPDELVESYKTATNWSTYASQIKGISELE